MSNTPPSNTSIRTHYDNLQVARNASDVVIRAAYKSLAQNYHPDRTQNDPEQAARAMQIINVAYQILSDPDSRREHDRWIAEMEAKSRAQAAPPQVETGGEQPAIASSQVAYSGISPDRIGTPRQYEEMPAPRGLFSRLFVWLLLGFAGVSMIPFVGQVLYWFRFKAWVALPARLAFGHDGSIPAGMGALLPGNGMAPAIGEWLYHPVGASSVHNAVYSILDTLNISFFFLLVTILVFCVLQFFKERLAR